MKGIVKVALAIGLLAVVGGCTTSAIDGIVAPYKYMLTGPSEPPPRTIEAAQAEFNDGALVVGQSTEANLTSILGSPAQIKKDNGKKVYVYLKNVSTRGVSNDVGTSYVASYTFDQDGKLADKEYAAHPMSNPLTGQ